MQLYCWRLWGTKWFNFRWETLNFCFSVCFCGICWGWVGKVHSRSRANGHIWDHLNIRCSSLSVNSTTPISVGVAWPSSSSSYSLMILEPNPSVQTVFPTRALCQAFLPLIGKRINSLRVKSLGVRISYAWLSRPRWIWVSCSPLCVSAILYGKWR